jgi:hypothetical protein
LIRSCPLPSARAEHETPVSLHKTAILLVAAVLSGVGGAPASLAQATDYRVSGVVFGSSGRSLAIVERAAQDSVLLGVGDSLDEGEVLEIGERFVRVRFEHEDLLLPLSGGPAQTVSSESSSLVIRDASAPGIHGVLTHRLLGELEQIRDSLDNRDDSTRDPQLALTEQIRDLIGLPAGAVIKNINGESFASVAEGISLLEMPLHEQTLIRLELEGGEYYEPLYLQP